MDVCVHSWAGMGLRSCGAFGRIGPCAPRGIVSRSPGARGHQHVPGTRQLPHTDSRASLGPAALCSTILIRLCPCVNCVAAVRPILPTALVAASPFGSLQSLGRRRCKTRRHLHLFGGHDHGCNLIMCRGVLWLSVPSRSFAAFGSCKILVVGINARAIVGCGRLDQRGAICGSEDVKHAAFHCV